MGLDRIANGKRVDAGPAVAAFQHLVSALIDSIDRAGSEHEQQFLKFLAIRARTMAGQPANLPKVEATLQQFIGAIETFAKQGGDLYALKAILRERARIRRDE
jgi:hypothetical protein